jgi:glycosyltransferase involved in cell wall biosynthesis
MRILYITYDGLTEFIGQSQILPYLLGSAGKGNELTVISFEKEDRRNRLGTAVSQLCDNAGIAWRPQRFRATPPYISKYLDVVAMRRAAMSAADDLCFDMVHCRSYPAARVGLGLKQRHGLPLLFDMRGFWPDQRREGGRWRRGHPAGRWLYSSWKKHEAQLVRSADHIVVLTEAARREIGTWPSYRGQPLSVIPCCADFSVYTVRGQSERDEARAKLGLPVDAPVLAYLGSLGTVYRAADHLRLYAAIRARDPRAKCLFIGRNNVAEVLEIARNRSISLQADDIRTIAAEREEVGRWLGAADAGGCFITPTFSSVGVSPTKLAEYLACGVPVIANSKVGDVEAIVAKLDGGHVLPDFSEPSIDAAAGAFFCLRSADRAALRGRAKQLLDLSLAVDAYEAIYDAPGAAIRIGSCAK